MYWILELFLIVFLLWISVTDIQKQIISNKAIGLAIVVRLVYCLFTEGVAWQEIVWALLNGIIIAMPLLVLVLVAEKILKKELMGGGDIKLLFVIGMYIGWEKSLVAFFFACIIGIVIGLINMRKDRIYFPFGPSIALGTMVSILIS